MKRLGEKIRELRKARDISQETLADALGVSFQAVSKWERGETAPDVTLIPAIASYFGVSTDELFGFDLHEVEKKVDAIVDRWRELCVAGDEVQAEMLVRDALKQYPGNETLLNCLADVIPADRRADEVIELCKTLISSAKSGEAKLDAYRLLAEAYSSAGEYELCREAVSHIPEVYFSRLYVEASLLKGTERFAAAKKEEKLCLEHLVYMLTILADHYEKQSEPEKARTELEIALGVLEAYEPDFPTEFTKSAYDPAKIAVLRERVAKLSKV